VPSESVPEISVRQLKEKLDRQENVVLLDIREPHEVKLARIEGAVHIPMGEIPQRVEELSREKEILVHCHTGMRSLLVGQYLLEAGFPRVASVAGGIEAWSREIDPKVPRYFS